MLWGCGANGLGELGNGSPGDLDTFNPSMADARAVSARGDQVLVVGTDGTRWASGQNCYSQLGTGDTTDATAFIAVQIGVAAMCAGMFFSLASKSGGSLVACGSGYGNCYSEILTGVEIVSTACHLLAVRQDGTLWARVGNIHGGLGTGDNTDRSSFVQVLVGVADIAAGEGYSIAVLDGGSLMACGRNGQEQLGAGDFADRNVFTSVW